MILVTGATGLNGSELVHRLSARGVPVRALVRSVAKSQRLSALPQVEIVQGDMARPETIREALRGVGDCHKYLAIGQLFPREQKEEDSR